MCLSHLSREIKKIKSVGFPALVMLGGEWEVSQKEQHSFLRIVRVILRREVVRMTVTWKILNVLASKWVIMFLSTVTNKPGSGNQFLQYNSLQILHFAISYLTLLFFFYQIDLPNNHFFPQVCGLTWRWPTVAPSSWPWKPRWISFAWARREKVSAQANLAKMGKTVNLHHIHVGTAFVGFNAVFFLLLIKRSLWSLVSTTLPGTSPVSLSVLCLFCLLYPPPFFFPAVNFGFCLYGVVNRMHFFPWWVL